MIDTIINGIKGLEIFNETLPMLQPTVSEIFNTVISRLFLRENTQITEFEKLKQAQFADVAKKLLDEGKMTYLEYYKCKNFADIAKKADEFYGQEIENSQNKSTTDNKKQKIDFDWFIYFFEDVGNISDEEVQNLWAKILTGEIKQPKSFSLRTLNTLKNLSKDEAETLQNISDYAIKIEDKYYICLEEELTKKYNYNQQLITMYDCGIIENNIAYVYNFDVPLSQERKKLLFRYGNLVCFAHNEINTQCTINLQRITKPGNELMKLFLPSKNSFFIDLCKIINKKNPNLKLGVYPIIREKNDNISFCKISLI